MPERHNWSRLQSLLERDDVENVIITGHNSVWADLSDRRRQRVHLPTDRGQESGPSDV